MLGQRENAQAVAGALFERDRIGFAGLSSATASLMTSDFDAEPALRFRIGFAFVCGRAAADIGATRGWLCRGLTMKAKPRGAGAPQTGKARMIRQPDETSG